MNHLPSRPSNSCRLQADGRHPAFDLLFGDDQRGFVLVGAIRWQLHDGNASVRLQIAGRGFEERCAVLDVVQNVVKERDVHVACRQLRIRIFPEYGCHVADIRRGGLLLDPVEEAFVDVLGVHFSAGRHR